LCSPQTLFQALTKIEVLLAYNVLPATHYFSHFWVNYRFKTTVFPAISIFFET